MIGATCVQAAQSESLTFKTWRVDIQVDDFEGEVKPTLTAEVLSVEGQKIGIMSIGYFVAPKGHFSSALDVHFISSSPVELQPAYRVEGGTRHVQSVEDED
jgi:hypothetical protein